jgi:hypothetical protein
VLLMLDIVTPTTAMATTATTVTTTCKFVLQQL